MKADVSLPAPLLQAADRLAQRLEISRNESIAAALERYLRSHGKAEITERLNEIYREQESSLDLVLAAIQSVSLPLEEW